MLVDVKADRAAALAQRLGMYRLRAKVAIAGRPRGGGGVRGAAGRGLSPTRGDPALGWRAYVGGPGGAPRRAWRRSTPAAMRARRIGLGVPETGVELVPEDSYILEMGFERLHGVDFRKGCYVGQEVTARMKHKTELRKGLVAGAGRRPDAAAAARSWRATRWPARSTRRRTATGSPTCASTARRAAHGRDAGAAVG